MTAPTRPSAGDTAKQRFRALFARHYPAIFGYAARRVGHDDAPDTTAEVFTVAWRRISSVPSEPETLQWLHGVARRIVANQQRARRRRDRLDAKVVGLGVTHSPPPTEPVLEALHRLSDDDKEILRLAAWEGLDPADLGSSLGCSPTTATVRLHRARKRLAAALEDLDGGPR